MSAMNPAEIVPIPNVGAALVAGPRVLMALNGRDGPLGRPRIRETKDFTDGPAVRPYHGGAL